MHVRIVVALLIAVAASPTVVAHAFLDHAVPAVGSRVRGAPSSVALWFTQELEPAFSTVKVLDAEGRAVDRGDKNIDLRDRTVLRVTLAPLAPGTYRVVWRVLSVDTHVTEGDFTFVVLP
jgi:methionine-rich copper-binding protein CopC